MTFEFLQQYWWFIVSLLGALLVFLMFVQGGNVLVFTAGKTELERRMMVNSTGRKWDLTFTTLVTFGGAFFASFPLFYSTSFSGAYWVWMLILLTFVLQAVSYEFQNKKGNIAGAKTYATFLLINGLFAPFLIGAAVGTFFTGSDFLVEKGVIATTHVSAISTWGTELHGLEVILSPNMFCLIFGLMLTLLTIVLGGLYLINNIDDKKLNQRLRRQTGFFSLAFLVVFLYLVFQVLTMPGYAVNPTTGEVFMQDGKYLLNFIQMPLVAASFLIGVVLVLVGIYLGVATKSIYGIWSAGVGVVLVAVSLFLVVGLNNTAFYPSATHLQSSLTIHNASSGFMTLKVMFWVSMLVPFVATYIFFVWRAMDKQKITSEEMQSSGTKY